MTRGLLYRSNHVSPTYGDRYGVYTVHIIYCTYSTVLYSVELLRSIGTYFLSCCSKPYHRRTFCYFQVPQQFKFVVFILFLINIITLHMLAWVLHYRWHPPQAVIAPQPPRNVRRRQWLSYQDIPAKQEFVNALLTRISREQAHRPETRAERTGGVRGVQDRD